IYTYPEGMGWDIWNLLETIGAFVIASSMMVFVANVVLSRQRREEPGADPWDARTLEWATTSPPPEYNFPKIPLVRHRDDFWHRKYIETPEGEPAPVFAGGAEHRVEEAAEHHDSSQHGEEHIHMPSPSYFPLVAAVGPALMAYGVIVPALRLPLLFAGAGFALLGFFGWVLEPPTAEEHG
ncbi:MAG: cytochrome ubiquinol oxidase subunit I, partial [Actinomycetota bacterium]